MLTEKEIYDYLQSFLPSMQFVNPYLDDVPLPNTDYATMNIVSIEDKGRNQPSKELDEDEKITYFIERILKVQFDFWGSNSFDKARLYKEILQINLDIETQLDKAKLQIKKINKIFNLTSFLENKKYFKRYMFDADLFIIDIYKKDDIFIDSYENKVLIVGN